MQQYSAAREPHFRADHHPKHPQYVALSVNAPLEIVLGFELRRLGGDEAEDDLVPTGT
jgi:hypothetical protein